MFAQRVVVRLGLRVAGERPSVGPCAGGFDRHDLGRGRGQELSVVTDEDDRLARLVELALEPSLGRHIEEVVGLIEHENLELAAQERFERQSLLLAAAECAQRSIRHVVERLPEGARRALVPQHLGVVPTDVVPCADRHRVLHRVFVERRLGRAQRIGGIAQARRRHRQQKLADGRRRVVGGTDELVHHAERTVDTDGAGGRGGVADHEAEQRRFSHTVRSDQRDPVAVADVEADLAKELVAAW